MSYILYMNKDVIYLEPEDDITDIISKIEKSKEKIVALVPPKKAGVLRSVVNMKLIQKAGASSKKAIVLITTDASIIKLAAANKLPVTGDLKTAPVIPRDSGASETTSKEELVEVSDGTVETEEDVEELTGQDSNSGDSEDNKSNNTDSAKDTVADDGQDSIDSDEQGADEKSETQSSKSKGKDSKAPSRNGKNRFLVWLAEHKVVTITSGIGIVLFVLILVWALVIAPSVTVTVGIRTASNNFSEAISFTTALTEEDATTGKFYLEEKKISATEEVKFEATGKKNIGKKATGSLVAQVYFSAKGSYSINAGTEFTINDLVYLADEDSVLSWNGNQASCENNDRQDDPIIRDGVVSCLKSVRVKVTAAEPGERYNIAKSSAGWHTVASVAVYSDDAMAGGTDEEITIVLQSDIDQAQSKLNGANLEENKEKLIAQLGNDKLIIESSLKQELINVESTPKVGEEVKPDVKPTLKATTVTSIFAIDKTKVKEFIAEKANLRNDQEIYEMKDPFIESFIKTDTGYTGKLKTSYLTGPMLNNTSVVNLIKGRGLGDAQHLLKDIDGVTEVRINTSFPWVTTIPDDSDRISVDLEIKDQNGNKVEHQGINRTQRDAEEESQEEAPAEKQDEENPEEASN